MSKRQRENENINPTEIAQTVSALVAVCKNCWEMLTNQGTSNLECCSANQKIFR